MGTRRAPGARPLLAVTGSLILSLPACWLMIYLPLLSMAVGPGLLQPPPLRTQLRVRVFEGGPAVCSGALGGLRLPHGSSTRGLLSPGVWLLVSCTAA